MIDVSDLVFTRCKDAIETEYGEDNVAIESSISGAPAKFPAVRVRQLGAPSTGSSFTSRQCACVSTVEVQTYSTESAEESKDLIMLCADTLDEMGYALVSGIEDITQQIDLNIYVARFRRTIGAGDSL